MEHEEFVKAQWWLQQLCETDRKIVGRKRRDVQQLIHQIIVGPINTNPLAVVPVSTKKRSKATSESLTSSIPRLHNFEWKSSMESFYQQIPISMGNSLSNSELALNPMKQITFYENPTSVKSNETIVARPNSFDIKTIRSVMENELAQLGVSRLQKMLCNTCCSYFPSNYLYIVTLPNKNKTQKSSIARCGSCWKGPFPSRSIFDLLINGIAVKWAKMVGKRVEYLYGEWNEMLNPMVKMLKENVLLTEDIETLLTSCTDPEEFKDACEVIIITTIVFYLEYVDFRRSCEALIAMKPTVTYSQLFEIFSIYFPNRAKGIKTGDFL